VVLQWSVAEAAGAQFTAVAWSEVTYRRMLSRIECFMPRCLQCSVEGWVLCSTIWVTELSESINYCYIEMFVIDLGTLTTN